MNLKKSFLYLTMLKKRETIQCEKHRTFNFTSCILKTILVLEKILILGKRFCLWFLIEKQIWEK